MGCPCLLGSGRQGALSQPSRHMPGGQRDELGKGRWRGQGAGSRQRELGRSREDRVLGPGQQGLRFLTVGRASRGDGGSVRQHPGTVGNTVTARMGVGAGGFLHPKKERCQPAPSPDHSALSTHIRRGGAFPKPLTLSLEGRPLSLATNPASPTRMHTGIPPLAIQIPSSEAENPRYVKTQATIQNFLETWPIHGGITASSALLLCSSTNKPGSTDDSVGTHLVQGAGVGLRRHRVAPLLNSTSFSW